MTTDELISDLGHILASMLLKMGLDQDNSAR